MKKRAEVARGAVVVPCSSISAALSFYCDQLGFRVELISPADDPSSAVVSGGGLRLLIDRTCSGPAPTLQLDSVTARIEGPDGVVVEPAPVRQLVVPPLVSSLSISRLAGSVWGTGRAGMRYRDLIPDRLGGRYIASHIEITDGGPVPDYVHFHEVRFQMIFCWRGWVRVVYEGQGEPFVLAAGDCVLQPPTIRHRVLESSANLEVIELSSPALHDTCGDLELELPDDRSAPDRAWRGQQFVHHRASQARWVPWRLPGWRCRDTGIAAATGTLASVVVARADGDARSEAPGGAHDGELRFLFVLSGSLRVSCGTDEELAPGDSVALPAGLPHSISADEGTEVLEVQL